MRKLIIAAVAAASVLGGAMIAQGVQAQPYGYYARAPRPITTTAMAGGTSMTAYGRHYVERLAPRLRRPRRSALRSIGPVLGSVLCAVCPSTATAPTRTA